MNQQYIAKLQKPVLQVDKVNKIYHPNSEIANQVLYDISFEIQPGEFCSLVGSSGSGKSSLLNLLGLLDTPTSGEICIDGVKTTNLDDDGLTKIRGEKIGFIFQFHHLLPAFSALENVLMPQLINGIGVTDTMLEAATQMLDQVGLKAQKNKLPNQLSGGQQQRVAVARALFAKPQLLLADEPTGNLDSSTAREIFDLLYRLNRSSNSACLMVTHDSNLAARCDRSLTLVDGKLQ